jgi:ATP synthase I chain
MRSAAMVNESGFYGAAERRIEYFTVGLGAAGAVCAGTVWGIRAGLGVASGAALAWINYRWMKQGVGALANLAKPQQGAEKVYVPRSVYFKFMGRYVLLIGAAYVILSHFNLPVASVLVGFSAIVAAVLLEVIGQLFRSNQIPHAGS